LLARGERRLRALPDRLDAVVVAEPVWRALDPAGGSLRDIDTLADLTLRSAMLEEVATTIVGTAPGGRALVGIDGVDGAGKSTFADELAEVVGGRRPVVRATIDRFHRPAAARYARGRTSPEGFYLDSFDLDSVTTRLLDPFRRGDAVVTGVFDHRRDEPDVADPIDPASDAVLLFDGIFLHRPELADRWDLSVFLDVRPEVSVARLAARDGSDPDPTAASNARYVEGQRMYLRTVDPASRADIVVEQDDLWRPRVRLRPHPWRYEPA
jgi:uridine kinase